MADNRKYYYLKLKENFFDSDSIVLLEDMKRISEDRSSCCHERCHRCRSGCLQCSQ